MPSVLSNSPAASLPPLAHSSDEVTLLPPKQDSGIPTGRISSRDLSVQSGLSSLAPQQSQSARYGIKGMLPESQLSDVIGSRAHSRHKAHWRFRDWLLGTGRGQWLALVAIAVGLVLMGSFSWMATGGDEDGGIADNSVLQSLWISWGLFFDPGTQTGVPPDAHIRLKVVAVVFSVLGFVFNLAVLGLIVDQVRDQLQRWKSMRNRIILNGHTLILGWGERTLFLLSELLTAYEHELNSDQEAVGRTKDKRAKLRGKANGCCTKRRRVIIMASKEAIEMEQEAKTHLQGNRLNAAGIYFWNGDPTDWKELEKVSPQSADDIIVLGKGANSDDSDQHVLQILLALAALPQGGETHRQEEMQFFDGSESRDELTMMGRRAHTRSIYSMLTCCCSRAREVHFGEVWAEMRIPENVRVAPVILKEACGIVAREAVNRLLCLTVLEPAVGLSLLDVVSFMSGDQIYVTKLPANLIGKSFAEACFYFPEAVLVGAHKKGTVTADGIAPSPDVRLEEQDELVLFAPSQHEAEICSWPQKQSNEKSACELRPPIEGQELKDLTDASNHNLKQNRAETICIIGCPSDFSDLLRIMELIIEPFDEDGRRSQVHILSERDLQWRNKQLERSFASSDDVTSLGNFTNSLGAFDVIQHIGPISSARHLAMLPLAQSSGVLILSECHDLVNGVDEDPTAADTRNLNTLITIKKYLPLPSSCRVLCELLDPRSEFVVQHNRELQTLGKFFYSNKLETSMFAMAAQNRSVFNTLMVILQPHNVLDVIAVPISSYIRGCTLACDKGCVCRPEMLNFWELHSRVQHVSGGVLLGWQRIEGDGTKHRRPNVNPLDKLTPKKWHKDSGLLIVIRREAGYDLPEESVPELCHIGAELVDDRVPPSEVLPPEIPGQLPDAASVQQ